MCWITLNPKKRKHHHHHHDNGHDPSVEHLIQRDRISFDIESPLPTTLYPSHHPHDTIRIIAPKHHNHDHQRPHLQHRHHHHMHPLHLHPIKLHGPGRKRAPPPPPPPPSREHSRPRRSNTREPVYRIQPVPSSDAQYRVVIAEPATEEIRETTRIALRESRPGERRLRRVAGYELLGREAPWSWDCISSVDGTVRDSGRGARRNGRGRRDSGLRYPPANLEEWM